MDKKNALLFDELIRHKRIREIKAVAMATAALLLLLIFLFVPFGRSESDMGNGTVLSWSRAQSDEGSTTYILWTELSDGSKVNVLASQYGRSPVIGESIRIVQVKSLFRGAHYRWKRYVTKE